MINKLKDHKSKLIYLSVRKKNIYKFLNKTFNSIIFAMLLIFIYLFILFVTFG